MKSVQKFFALGAVLAASSSFAFADSMTATIGVGPVTGETTTITSSSISFDPAAGRLTSATGDLSAYQGSRVSLSELTFGSGTSTGLEELLVNLPGDFTFTVNSIDVILDNPGNSLVLEGTGTFAGTGLVSSTGTFFLSSSDSTAGSGSSTSLEITAASITPEPNSLVLMGTGLIGAAGLLFMRRRNASDLV